MCRYVVCNERLTFESCRSTIAQPLNVHIFNLNSFAYRPPITVLFLLSFIDK